MRKHLVVAWVEPCWIEQQFNKSTSRTRLKPFRNVGLAGLHTDTSQALSRKLWITPGLPRPRMGGLPQSAGHFGPTFKQGSTRRGFSSFRANFSIMGMSEQLGCFWWYALPPTSIYSICIYVYSGPNIYTGPNRCCFCLVLCPFQVEDNTKMKISI